MNREVREFHPAMRLPDNLFGVAAVFAIKEITLRTNIMIDKDRYFEILKHILSEHYNIMSATHKIVPERQQFIDGYITAAIALDALSQEELKGFIEKLHFEVFGMTIQERQKAMTFENGTEDDSLAVPAYIRKGVDLAF